MLDDTAYMSEYLFTEGDMIKDILSGDLNVIRETYANNCVGLARYVKSLFQSCGVLSAVITFKNHDCFFSPLKVTDELTNTERTYTHHSVVLLGDCIMDILHTDRLISTREYAKHIRELNPNVEVTLALSDGWFDSAGYLIPVDIDYLENYKLD